MKITIIVSILCLHKVISLMMTKFDTDTITTYLKLVRHSKNANDAMRAFHNENVREYCQELRRLDFFGSLYMLTEEHARQQARDPTYHIIPEHILEIEQKPREKQIRRIQITNMNHTMNFLSFYCLNLRREPRWLIAPAFIPDSAFLFEIEPTFRYVASREINQENEIPARLIGIIDKSGSFISTNLSHYQNSSINFPEYPHYQCHNYAKILKSFKYSSKRLILHVHNTAKFVDSRDRLCDLKSILQTRLCFLVDDVERRTQTIPRGVLSSDYRSTSSQAYQHGSAESEERCKKPTRPTREISFNEMLYCSVEYLRFRSSFYVASNVLSYPSEVFYCAQHVINSTLWFTSYARFKIPLLEHLHTYNTLLSNSDI